MPAVWCGAGVCWPQVHNLDNVKVSTVACGWRHSVAATSDGRLFTWGWSKYGQLGHGDNK